MLTHAKDNMEDITTNLQKTPLTNTKGDEFAIHEYLIIYSVKFKFFFSYMFKFVTK